MAKVGSFLHDSFVVPNSTPVLGTSFATADVHTHPMGTGLPPFRSAGDYYGIIEGIHVKLTSIAGGATTCTIRVCLDANGDTTIVPDTTATIATGITTATSGCIAVKVGLPVFQVLGGMTLYLFAKLDAGTADMVASCITWRE